jgi:uncharacterized protein
MVVLFGGLLVVLALADATKKVASADELRQAVREDDTARVQVLLQRGADPNVTISDQPEQKYRRPFIDAMLRALHLRSSRREGHPALIQALSNPNVIMAQALVDAGADVNALDSLGQSALVLAVGREDRALTSAMIDRGANVNIPDKYGRTALMAAASQNNTSIIELLVRHGASVDRQDSRGLTALTEAARLGAPSSVAALIRLGANPAIVDHEGKTAFQWARESYHSVRQGEGTILWARGDNPFGRRFPPTNNGELQRYAIEDYESVIELLGSAHVPSQN